MQQSRIVKIIKSLSPRQLEQFEDFVQSPYFNQHKKTTQLLKIIVKELAKRYPKLERERVFQQLFPKEKYNDQQLHNHLSYLMKLYHRFLAIQDFENNELDMNLSTLSRAYQDGQIDLFKNRAKLFEKHLDRTDRKDTSLYHIQFQFRNLMRDYTINHISRSDQQAGQEMLNQLDHYYILEKLRHTCLLTAHQMIMNTQYEFRFLDTILKAVESKWLDYEKHPTIAAYYTALMMLKEQESEPYYKQLRDLMRQHTKSFSFENLNELHEFATNYCIMRSNTGDANYRKELFELYKDGLQNEILLENGSIDGWVYKNITTLGCHLKEHDWTYNFIHRYQEKIKSSHKENAFNYSLAYYYVSKRDYSQALMLLNGVKFTEMQYYLGGSLLLMRSYYELDQTEPLIALLESLRIYSMRSKKMNTVQKKSYMNMVRFTKQLVVLKNDKPYLGKEKFSKRLQQLDEKVQENKNTAAKDWIVRELKALRGVKV